MAKFIPILCLLFFIFMLGVTAYRLLKTGNSEQKTDMPEVDKYMNLKGGVPEEEMLEALQSENIDYQGVE